MHPQRGRTLCLSTVLVCLLDGGVSWGQTYNPTASDPITGNTAGGTGALPNDRGINNTGFGSNALASNTTTSSGNTATGAEALRQNTTGAFNAATGAYTLYSNTTGYFNTATGVQALFFNTTGAFNTATGLEALYSNTTGFANTAEGTAALRDNTTGIRSTALGNQALLGSTTGSANTALGWGAGSSLTSGSNNIYLGHPGAASESKTMRLGAVQTRTFIAGVAGRPVSGSQVLITNTGQLGILASLARYKQDIQPMGEQSQRLQQLRPVTFHYTEEPTGPLQYGLIAEEVAKVYPELVTRAADGTIEGVRYEELTPMLLNELQHQQREIAALKAQNAHLQTAVAQQAALAVRLERLEAAGVRTTVTQR